jgi:DNA polymerase-3 subunit alpha
MTDSIVHLHNHTSYSLLDGAAKIEPLVKAAVADGQPALAITDHGNLYGLIDFYRTCKKYDINPVLGIESYFCDDINEKGARADTAEIDGSDKRYYHLTVLAENDAGYRNLLKLSSESYLEGFYYKPRADWDNLARHSEGLIVTSGCLGGPVLQYLLHDNYEYALKSAARLQEIVGKDNFFIELQDHGIPEQAKTNPQLIEISRALDAPTIVANDCHYVHHDDHVAHDALLCVQTHSKISDEKRFKFQSDQHYLKTAEEMRYLFSEIPEACDNTLLIGERANVNIDFDTLHLPFYAPPEGFETPIAYLTHLSQRGLQKRYGSVSEESANRLAYELSVIDTLGLASYFLIVWDLVKFADRNNIRRGPARGSAAGSLVAYCMDITRVDPMRHGLLFERFLNPSRIALPDIDLDFDTRYRDMLIKYTIDKYGTNRVAQIITFSRIRARAAVRDASRVLGLPPSAGDKVAKAMPGLVMGESTPLNACFELNPRYETGYQNAEELRQMYAADPEVKQIVDVAKGLEDLVRQDSVHAAAVVITPTDLTDYIPIQRKPDGPIVTQYEKNTIEDLGLLKMDYLGLRNLDVISDTIEILGEDPGIQNTAFDDFDTFNLLREGKTIGVFQLESPPMRSLLQRLQPNSIDDIAAVVALYRPGPMASDMHLDYADRKNGREPVTFFHDDAKEILSSTYGLMIYQEQVMEIARRFAGYTLVEADGIRKIIGKKLRDKMATERDKFTQGCIDNGYTAELAKQLFDMIEAFAAYSFNKSHAYGYAYISYQTAFLKANYPKEYMAALCSSVVDKIEKAAVFMNEARTMGIQVLSPDINSSNAYFTATDEGIRTGLAAVKSIGVEFAEKIVNERKENGPYSSLIDFIQRIRPKVPQVETLALAGAFEKFGTRLGVHSVAGDVINQNRKVAKKVKKGQESLFDSNEMWDVKIPKQEFPPRILLENERQAIGIYVTGHPLDEYTAQATGVTVNDLEEMPIGEQGKVLVHITDLKTRYTKQGAKMANLTVSDQTGYLDTVCFPQAYKKSHLVEGELGIVTLKVGTSYDGERNYIVTHFAQINENAEEDMLEHYISFYLPQGFAQDDGAISKLKGVLLSHYGNTGVLLYVSKSTKLQLPDGIAVDPSDELVEDVRNLFKEFAGRK